MKKHKNEHEYLYWELYEGKPRCAVKYNNWKGVVLDMRKWIGHRIV